VLVLNPFRQVGSTFQGRLIRSALLSTAI